MTYISEIEKSTLKFHLEAQKTKIAKAILSKKSNVKGT
jgi:hypothetical protein